MATKTALGYIGGDHVIRVPASPLDKREYLIGDPPHTFGLLLPRRAAAASSFMFS